MGFLLGLGLFDYIGFLIALQGDCPAGPIKKTAGRLFFPGNYGSLAK